MAGALPRVPGLPSLRGQALKRGVLGGDPGLARIEGLGDRQDLPGRGILPEGQGPRHVIEVHGRAPTVRGRPGFPPGLLGLPGFAEESRPRLGGMSVQVRLQPAQEGGDDVPGRPGGGEILLQPVEGARIPQGVGREREGQFQQLAGGDLLQARFQPAAGRIRPAQAPFRPSQPRGSLVIRPAREG